MITYVSLYDFGILLLELDRLLKPGGYFAYSSPEAYAQDEEDLKIWREMSTLEERMCWKIAVKRNKTVIRAKPLTNECYEEREPGTQPPVCRSDDDPDVAWEVPMEACITPYSDPSHVHAAFEAHNVQKRLSGVPFHPST